MGKLANRVFEERLTRNAARAGFDARLAQVKQDLEARGVGSRIADKVGKQAHEAYDEAMAVAGDNKGVIAGTAAALLIWLLRNPIIDALDRLLGEDTEPEEEYDHDGQ